MTQQWSNPNNGAVSTTTDTNDTFTSTGSSGTWDHYATTTTSNAIQSTGGTEQMIALLADDKNPAASPALNQAGDACWYKINATQAKTGVNGGTWFGSTHTVSASSVFKITWDGTNFKFYLNGTFVDETSSHTPTSTPRGMTNTYQTGKVAVLSGSPSPGGNGGTLLPPPVAMVNL